ncbi:MAG: collagen-like protein [Pyrinomonadaceae bacterium]|nr:collagen-like protein [Pyrinomonadaceae bacterium]
MNTWKRCWLHITFSLVVLILSISFTEGQTVDKDIIRDKTTIHSCYEKYSGQLRRVDSPKECRHFEIALSWNAVGPQGPKGDQGDPGQSVAVTAIPPGANCAAGGIMVTGANGNQFVCDGPKGEKGDRGDTGPPGSSGSFSGLAEFTSSSTFTVPENVTHLQVELWGAGGGGGGGDSDGGIIHMSPGGAGGGSGGYSRSVIAVTPGEVLDVVIGRGGLGGPIDNRGQAGGSSELKRSGNTLLNAGGGGGGAPERPGGTGGSGDPNAPIKRKGHVGILSGDGDPGGAGGDPVHGSIVPIGTIGGTGGRGLPLTLTPGSAGSTGYAVISW